MKRLLISTVLVVAACICVQAQPHWPPERPGIPRPIQVRIEGYLGAKPPGVKAEADWRVKLKGKDVQLYVTKLRVLTGDVSYFDILTDVQPYSLAYEIYGPDQLLDELASTPPTQKIAVIGYLRLGSRELNIGGVEKLGES